MLKMSDDTEIDWTKIDTDITIDCSDFVGVKCPECGEMALKRTRYSEEYCSVCSYDKRTEHDL